METSVIVALIAAFAALLAGIANLYAGYRLKVKEFKVTQIKSRIDTLEQATVLRAPESNASEGKTEEKGSPLEIAMEGIKAGMWHRLGATEKQFTKYKWLLNPERHQAIETLLAECNEISGEIAVETAKPVPDIDKLMTLYSLFAEKTDDLHKAYEEARLSGIERLYFLLKNEVGI